MVWPPERRGELPMGQISPLGARGQVKNGPLSNAFSLNFSPKKLLCMNRRGVYTSETHQVSRLLSHVFAFVG
jgi:hypothetical protein